MKVPFEVFEHTADVGLRAWGRDERELFENAGRGMLAVIGASADVASSASRHVELQEPDREELLVTWLGELVFLLDSEGFLPGVVTVWEVVPVRGGGYRLRADLEGETVDPKRHCLQTEIKAVTRHDLAVRQDDEGLSVEIILDV